MNNCGTSRVNGNNSLNTKSQFTQKANEASRKIYFQLRLSNRALSGRALLFVLLAQLVLCAGLTVSETFCHPSK